MIHPRIDIRNQLAEHLRQNQTAQVFIGRAVPIFDQDLPAILVYTGNEQINRERWDTDGCGELIRELELNIEAVTIGNTDLDDKLDELAQSIESALDGWTMLNRKNAVLRFKNTYVDHSIDGNKIYGAVRLEYSLAYMTETHNND